MGTIIFHSNQSSYPTGIKKKHKFSFPQPIDALCVIWKESASRLQGTYLEIPMTHFFATWLKKKWGKRGPHNMDMFAAMYVSDARVDLGTAGHRLYVYDT